MRLAAIHRSEAENCPFRYKVVSHSVAPLPLPHKPQYLCRHFKPRLPNVPTCSHWAVSPLHWNK